MELDLGAEMIKTILVILMLVPVVAHAETWDLLHSSYGLSGWTCVYQLRGSMIQTTIVQSQPCALFAGTIRPY
jgi:hypothetical protein